MTPLEFELDTRIESAWTIPSRLYTDPEVLEQERRRIFHRTWQLAGMARQVESPCSYFTAEVAGEPVVVVRGHDGELRAFHNVCRHRAGPVAEASGCANVFRCAYHGWTYTLDGRLIGTPEVDGMEFFDRRTMPLVPARVDTWREFVFVCLDAEAPPLESFFEPVAHRAAKLSYPPLEFVERRDYVISCNWKVYVDNYLEGYHIPVAHPGLMREIDYLNYRTETFRFASQQHAPLRRAAEAEAPERVYAAEDGAGQALYFWVFPNLMLNYYPGNLSTNLVVPLAHDRTLTIFEWFIAPQADDAARSAQRESIRKAVEFSDQVQQEDIRLCESVQKGLRSASYDRGRYAVKRENGVHHFHTLLKEFLGQPASGI